MRVLFFHPEKYLNYGIPAGISILSAIIKKHGHTVELFDTTFLKVADDQHVLTEDDASSNTTAGDQSLPEIDFADESLLGKQIKGLFKETAYSMNDLVKDDPYVKVVNVLQSKIDSFKPDIIAISTMTTTFDYAVELLSQVNYQAKVIVGGVHPTIATDDCLDQGVIDIACVGEADESFPELLNLMDQGLDYTQVKGMHFKVAGKPYIHNEVAPRVDLNTLPTPDWGLFDSRHLFRPFDGEIYQGSFYAQARGCPMQCTYCVDPTIAEVTGGRSNYFRYQKPEVTYKQLSELKEKFNATWFKFVDDTFLMPPIEHLEELRDLIKPLDLKFGCSVMPNTIKENKVKLAVEMGCVAMSVGIESGNAGIRKSIMRRYKNEDVVSRLRMVQDYGVRVSTFNIIGFPGETRENAFETIELNRQIGSGAANVYVLYPYPGTPIAIDHNIPLRDENGKIASVDMGPKLGFSEMSENELLGIRSTFNAYMMLPKSLYPIIKIAEEQSDRGSRVLQLMNHLTVASLSETVLPMAVIGDIVNVHFRTVSGYNRGIQVPKLFTLILNLSLSEIEFNQVVEALVNTYDPNSTWQEEVLEPESKLIIASTS